MAIANTPSLNASSRALLMAARSPCAPDHLGFTLRSRSRSAVNTDLDLTHFEALRFDCYGTRIDWEAGIAAVLAPWAREHGLDLTDEALLLAYAGNEAAVERESLHAPDPDPLPLAVR